MRLAENKRMFPLYQGSQNGLNTRFQFCILADCNWRARKIKNVAHESQWILPIVANAIWLENRTVDIFTKNGRQIIVSKMVISPGMPQRYYGVLAGRQQPYDALVTAIDSTSRSRGHTQVEKRPFLAE